MSSIQKFKGSLLSCLAILFTVVIVITQTEKSFGQMPSHFQNSLVVGGMQKVEGVVFDHNKRMYAWEKGGRVWVIDSNGVKGALPLIALSPEVGNWVDHGLNGVALDPDFEHNGYIYLDYTVDRHYLLKYGTPQYNKDSNEYYNATIARVTRYTVDISNNYNSIVPGSRLVLIGSTKKNGIPITHMSHGSCGLVFGTDGTLLIPTGDGAAYGQLDNGSNNVSYAAQALADSIITPDLNVGAFRSQLMNSMNGKILRIDPSTGNGVPSNPYYQPSDPASAQSKVWCMGLRNPFKIVVKPGSGSTNPADGNPGVIYVGDVGWANWEEVNIADKPKLNFGWPLFEGLDYNAAYKVTITPDYFAPNPLFGVNGCTQQYFNFQDLLMQATLDSTKTFNNPCNPAIPIPSSVYTYQHTRPALAYKHGFDSTSVGIFNGNNAVGILISDTLSPCRGEQFDGDCVIGGGFYNGTVFPAEFRNRYYFGEFEDGYICNIKADSNNVPFSVNHFAFHLGEYSIVHITENPFDGSLIFVKYPDEIRKICYACLPDGPPVAIAKADTTFGNDVLNVSFSADSSSDPDNSLLTYSWDFGDGYSSNLENPQHIFNAPIGMVTNYQVVLTVTDDSSHSATDTIIITMNNTGPQIQVIGNTTFCQGNFVKLKGPTGVVSYLWSNGNTKQTITVTTSGTYRVTVTYSNGSTASSATKIITVNPNPIATLTPSGTASICGGVGTVLNVSTNAGYLWSTGAETQSIIVNSVGTYSVTVMNAFGCTTVSSPIIVNTGKAPTATISGPSVVCYGTPASFDGGAGFINYQWSNGCTTQVNPLTNSGTYTITITGTNGCTASTSKTLLVNPSPATVIDSTLIIRCNFIPVTVVATGASSYAWTPSTGLNASTGASVIASPSVSTFYTVTGSNGFGCSSTATFKFAVRPTPLVKVDPTSDIICNGTSRVLNATGGLSYIWSPANGLNITTGNSVIATLTNSTIYTVTGTGTNGCTTSKTSAITVACPIPKFMFTSSIGKTNATLHWTDVSCGINYNVQYRAVGNLNWTNANGLTKDSLVLYGLNLATTYEWHVRANCDSVSHSVFSALNKFTTTALKTSGIIEFEPGSLNIFPNPVIDELNLTFALNTSSATVFIYDESGKKVFEKLYLPIEENYYQINTDMSENSAGIYTVVVSGGEKPMQLRFVKN